MTAFCRFMALAIALGPITASVPALAGPGTDAFGQCLVGETTGNDRILLVRWMTTAFSAHPAVQDAVTVDASKIDAIQRDVAQLFTELVTQRCVVHAKAAVAETADPSIAFRAAFQVLGEAASLEVMQSPEVNAAIGGFANYIDQAAFDAIMTP